MNTLSGTLLFLLALLMSGSTYADSTAATSTTPTDTSSLSSDAMTDETPKHATKEPDTIPLKKHTASTEPTATDSEAEAPAVDPSNNKHSTVSDTKTADNSEKTKAVNYDEEEQPDEDSCD